MRLFIGFIVTSCFRILLMTGIFSIFASPAFAELSLKEMSAMPGTSWRAPLPPLTHEERSLAQRLERHVTAIASREHNMNHFAPLEEAAGYLEKALAAYGYQVRCQEFSTGKYRVRNLEVSLKPENADNVRPKLIVVGAHYDSAPGAPGANDNGSGTAAVVELAGLLSNLALPKDKEIRLVLFVNEEAPFFGTPKMGSWVHAQELYEKGEKVDAMLSLETIGYYSDEKGSQKYPSTLASAYPDTGNFIGFVSDPKSRDLLHRAIASFRKHASFPSEGLAAPQEIPGVAWSDHWAYWRFGYPAIMITDTAPYRYPYYHTSQDTPDKIDYEKMARVVKGIELVIRDLAGTQ